MTAGLLHNALPGINEDDDQAGIRCTGDHITGVLYMARCISNNEFPFGGGKVPVGYIDRDALFAFGTEPVCEQGQIDGTVLFIAGLFFQGFELVGQDILAVVQQAADEGAFSIIYRAGGDKAEKVHNEW